VDETGRTLTHVGLGSDAHHPAREQANLEPKLPSGGDNTAIAGGTGDAFTSVRPKELTIMPHTTAHVVFAIFDRMTHLDFTGPHQVFSAVPDARVTVASMGGRDIEAQGLVFSRLADLSKVEKCDVLCVPGGSGTSAAMVDEAFLREIRRLAGGAKYLTSVCTGSFILAAAGLLRGKRATTHWATRELLAPLGAIIDEGRVVRDGNVITGGGVTAGIDFALVAVAEIFGRATAEAVQLRLEYAPTPPFGSGRPENAPAELVTQVRDRLNPVVVELRAAVEEAVQTLQAAQVLRDQHR
jgi:cyclohexyl-isocyanide hydratase